VNTDEGPKRRPAPGTVLGVIAVVISLTGSAYAISLARNSVKSKHIAPNAVKSKDIGKNAVKGVDAKESTFAQVPSAATAAGAGQVDGHDAVCPPDTFLQSGVCFDTAVRFPSVDWTGANQECADNGGYLPSTSELMSIRGVTGVDLGGVGNGHWADARYQDAGVNEAMTVLDNGTLEGDLLAGPNQLRCAFKLVR
jgi:hypothetical protein